MLVVRQVNVRSILEGMMDRLASYAESNPDAISPELKYVPHISIPNNLISM